MSLAFKTMPVQQNEARVFQNNTCGFQNNAQNKACGLQNNASAIQNNAYAPRNQDCGLQNDACELQNIACALHNNACGSYKSAVATFGVVFCVVSLWKRTPAGFVVNYSVPQGATDVTGLFIAVSAGCEVSGLPQAAHSHSLQRRVRNAILSSEPQDSRDERRVFWCASSWSCAIPTSP